MTQTYQSSISSPIGRITVSCSERGVRELHLGGAKSLSGVTITSIAPGATVEIRTGDKPITADRSM